MVVVPCRVILVTTWLVIVGKVFCRSQRLMTYLYSLLAFVDLFWRPFLVSTIVKKSLTDP